MKNDYPTCRSMASTALVFSMLIVGLTTVATVNANVGSEAKADTLSIEQENNTQPVDSMGKPSTVSCPSEFHSVVLSSDATQCQQFESDIPAAMVYHTSLSPSQVISFYKERLPMFKTHSAINQRTLITSKERHTKIVVSPDDKGAQVDILVTEK